MPKIYEYFGIIFFFFKKEHLPVHVHAKYQGYETVFEFVFKNGKIVDVVKRRGNRNLPPSQMRDAEEFVWARKEQIYKKWKEVLVENKKVKMEVITRRVY